MEEASNKNTIREFTDLFAWQRCHSLVICIYTLTKSFPENEKFGLTSQIQRAVVSITSNIAEGFGRKGGKEKLQFYRVRFNKSNSLLNKVSLALASSIFYPVSLRYA